MSANTKIEWCDQSWSPWEGCTKVSPGCLNCYAEARDKRHLIEKVDHWGKGAPRRRTKDWKKPVKWNLGGGFYDGETLRRARVFPSVMDWLDDEVPIEWLADFLKLIHDTPHLDWLPLTKRPENWHQRVDLACQHIFEQADATGTLQAKEPPVAGWLADWLKGTSAPANLWVGASVEDQQRADERIPELLRIPAAVRFLSLEPLLGAVNLRYVLGKDGWTDGVRENRIHWLIIGGESGPGARPCNVDDVCDLVRQGRNAGVKVFVKQVGSRPEATYGSPRLAYFEKHGWPTHPKGGDPAEWPEDLRVREFPQVPA